jgi:molybdopterin molybdotransferase
VTIVRDAAGAVRVRPATAGGSGSHLVASLALADGLAVVDAEVEEVSPGDVVEVLDWRDQPASA